MPIPLTYPGVYVEEVPSGVRTITGVATSIAAFVGWAPKGPTDRADLVLSWTDFERAFGGLDPRSVLGYSVGHFFDNGGQKAYVVRLAAPDAKVATQTFADLKVTAVSEGAWGNDYAVVTKRRSDNPSRFLLQIFNVGGDPKGVMLETFADLSMDRNDRRFVGDVLGSESAFVRAELSSPNAPPPPPPADTGSPDPATGAIPAAAKLAGGEDGTVLEPSESDFHAALLPGSRDSGIYHLDRVDLFNLLCVPGEFDPERLQTLQGYCRAHRALLIADCNREARYENLKQSGPDGRLTGNDAINAALYFPWLKAPDPLKQNRPREFPPSGFIAGLYARTDASRGVWKAPAGTDASLNGALAPTETLTNDENGVLNPLAINCIRTLPVYGTVVWGARTLQGNDERGSEWKYIPVRRMALFIEETLIRSLRWVVFEPNDEPLWAQIRLNVGAFMHGLFRQGALQGMTPHEAYLVKCDKETTIQDDINRGIVNILVGFAPLKPAEFVVVRIQQLAGQIQT